MIRSFVNRDTERLWQRSVVRRWAATLQRGAYRKLVVLDAATSLKDLSAAPGNRLEKLGGDRAGQYSIRINDQWRVCFEWVEGDAYEVEVTDYH
ncbi:MAG TPA: type II toxin-antitoxin system RelE/ParE family toxin [Blastocatellia bacterium]|nr:type II toxin-antitoxin system RelE/ParE family toxin [Blastocatellia bacterium]